MGDTGYLWYSTVLTHTQRVFPCLAGTRVFQYLCCTLSLTILTSTDAPAASMGIRKVQSLTPATQRTPKVRGSAFDTASKPIVCTHRCTKETHHNAIFLETLAGDT